jgi:hypothetical protein
LKFRSASASSLDTRVTKYSIATQEAFPFRKIKDLTLERGGVFNSVGLAMVDGSKVRENAEVNPHEY